MLIKVLGATDFISGLLLIFGAGIKLPNVLLIVLGIILVIKSSLGMWKGIGSWIDLVSGGVFILLVFFPLHWIVCIIMGILLIQKGIFSFVG